LKNVLPPGAGLGVDFFDESGGGDPCLLTGSRFGVSLRPFEVVGLEEAEVVAVFELDGLAG